MFISWSSNKNPSNNYLSSNNYDITENSNQFLISQQNKQTTSFLFSNSLNNADTNSSSQIFHNDNIPFNSSFLSECENDFDFLTKHPEQQHQTNPFESLEAFINYYNKLPNKTDAIQSLIQNKLFFLSLFESQKGIDIIIYILKQNHSISLCNIVIYYISFLHKNQQRKLSKLFTYLFNYGNVFIKNQIISITQNI